MQPEHGVTIWRFMRLSSTTARLRWHAETRPSSCFRTTAWTLQLCRGLARTGVRLIALRSAEYENLDFGEAQWRGPRTVYVRSYAPYAVADRVFALRLSIVWDTVRVHERVREGKFSAEGPGGLGFARQFIQGRPMSGEIRA
jgi:D-lactate dehydrogenase